MNLSQIALDAALDAFAVHGHSRTVAKQIAKDLGRIDVAGLYINLFDIDEQLILVEIVFDGPTNVIHSIRTEVFST